MKKIIVIFLLLTVPGFAYMSISLDNPPHEGLTSNSIIEIVYDSTGIWLGSAGGASYLANGDTEWQTFQQGSGLHTTEVSAMGASTYNGTRYICIGTLHNEYAGGQSVPYGDGFSITWDGGQNWLPDTVTYPPFSNYVGMLSYDIDMYRDDIYSANFYGGLLRSLDGGRHWDNLFLNTIDSLDLTDSLFQSYTDRYFAVKVDLSLAPDTISVWGGTAAGLVRYIFTHYDAGGKQDSDYVVAHRSADSENSLPGNHVVALNVNGTPGRIYDVYTQGDYAYIAHDFKGLRVVDISDPASPVEVGHIDTPGRAWSVYVSGNYAYVVNYPYGSYQSSLSIVDIGTPSSPQLVRTLGLSGRAVNVFVAGDSAYVANEIFGLQIFNVSSPADSIPDTTLFNEYGGVRDVYVQGDYAYLATTTQGLVIIDKTNPVDSMFVGRYAGLTYPMSVAVSDTFAYVADQDSGLYAINVSNPASPMIKDSFETPGTARSVAVADNGHIYVTNKMDLEIFHLAIPTLGDSLEFLGSYGTPGTALSVHAPGGYRAYVADNYFGMDILDVSAPDTILLVGNFAPVCSTYIWAACRVGIGEDGQQYAISYSPNYGKTWKTAILDSGWDFAFLGDTVLAAADGGLYISGQNYNDWNVITEMEDVSGERKYYPSGIYAVETVGSTIWAGGADGAVKSDDFGQTWTVYRSQLFPSDYYAYPSPFSPYASTRKGTTIHYLPPQTTNVTIKVYDFNMDLVKTVLNGVTRTGGVEADDDIWDGTNDKGEVVANGIYFFNIKLGTGEDWWGKVAMVK